MKRYLTYFILVLFVLVSCDSGNGGNSRPKVPGKSEMADLNRYLLQKDRERIQNYIERKNLSLKETPSGLWYNIISEGNGKFYIDFDKVIFDYNSSLLDGTPCYSSEELGPKEVVLGKTQIESGLDQGLRMLRHGGEAIFILPPFMAYGLPGDGKKIPSRSVIVYRIKTR